MMSAETFALLQQPQIALPICTMACATGALILRKIWSAGALNVLTVLFLLNWVLEFFTGASAVFFYIVLLLAFFGIAMRERAWAVIYVALMPVINWSFAAVPTAAIPAVLGGGQFQPLAIVTGLVLVVRDLAQREIKHWIWGAMIAGLVLSSLTSWIVVVFASGAAFLISETVDWAVYTFSKRPLSQRIMISSLASAPLDQVVFIGLASQIPGQSGIFALGTILAGVASKLFGAWVVSRIIAGQERRAGVTAPQNDMNPA